MQKRRPHPSCCLSAAISSFSAAIRISVGEGICGDVPAFAFVFAFAGVSKASELGM